MHVRGGTTRMNFWRSLCFALVEVCSFDLMQEDMEKNGHLEGPPNAPCASKWETSQNKWTQANSRMEPCFLTSVKKSGDNVWKKEGH